MPQQLAHQLDMAVPGRPVQRRRAVLAASVDRPADGEHPADDVELLVLGRVRQAAPVLLRQAAHQLGAPREQRLYGLLVALLQGLDQLQLVGTAFEQQLEQRGMAELAGHAVRRVIGAEHPDVDRAAAARIALGEPALGDARADRCRIGVEVAQRQLAIPQRRRHQQIGAAAARDEMARHFRPLAQRVLRRGRFVVHVAGVDLGAVVEQEPGDLDVARDVQRRLAVASAGVHDAGVGGDELLQPIEQAQARGGVRVDRRSALDQERLEPAIRVEHAEAAGPPVAARVDVGARFEQHVDQLAIPALNRHQQRGRAERAFGHRLVEPRLELGMALERLADPRGVAGSDRGRQRRGGLAHRAWIRRISQSVQASVLPVIAACCSSGPCSERKKMNEATRASALDRSVSQAVKPAPAADTASATTLCATSARVSFIPKMIRLGPAARPAPPAHPQSAGTPGSGRARCGRLRGSS